MLREAVRDEATERTWSEGVALARDQRVVGKRASGDELELEVRVPARATPYHVILNETHGEWECDCPSKEAVCAHVVAAVIAAENAGDALPTSTRNAPRIRYLLEPDPGGVRVERVLVHADHTEPMVGQLMSIIARNKGDTIATEECDLLADQLLGVRVGPISGEKLDRLLTVLATAEDVRWRGDPVKTSDEPVVPRAIVDDIETGVRVRIVADPEIAEVVAVGVIRTHDNVLRPIGEVDLSGPRLEKLPQQFDVPRSAVPELIGKTLPALAQRIAIEMRASSLPRVGGVKEEPRMQLDVAQDGDKLSVMATLVYGDPPRARIDGLHGYGGGARTTLVHLNGPLPIRDEDAERRLVHRLRDELNLIPGRRVELTGREAFQMQQGLATWLRTDAKAAGAAKLAPLEVRIAIDGDRLDVELAGSKGAASIGGALRRAGKPGSTSCRWSAVVGDACRWSGSTSTASGSPICSLRGAGTIAFRSTHCRISRGCARTSIDRRRRSSIACGRCSRGSRAFRTPRCRPASSASSGRINRPVSTGCSSVATPASAACSPTTWASARRSRRSPRLVPDPPPARR